MPSLIEIARTDPQTFASYTIEQVVAICGDGKLRDNTASSDQLRTFLALQTPGRLASYAQYCLDTKFDRSGFVLQDVVNEIGRRLGYSVTNGLYQGRTNAIGFDGIWRDGVDELLIEVKTTDAYRINLDTLFDYGTKLDVGATAQAKNRSCLIVVGRQDTGDLEAQVRGSRHAWTVRLVSVDALSKLMFINAGLEDQVLTDKIRKVLLPFEYTRVDHIVDLVFETQQEGDTESGEIQIETETLTGEPQKAGYEFTPTAELDAKRIAIARSFFASRSMVPVRKSKTNFADEGDILHIACAVSKRYDTSYQPYWYALHPAWLTFIESARNGYFILGCMDRNEAFALPLGIVQAAKDKLNTSVKKDGKMYWHVTLTEELGVLKWNLSKVSQKIDLSAYRFPI